MAKKAKQQEQANDQNQELTDDEKQQLAKQYLKKARYWWAVLYPENMIEGWEDEIAQKIQLPYAYCIHDQDLDKAGDLRKKHVHLLVVFPNTTTYKNALSVFKELGEKACNTCEKVISVRNAYDYLIHDTDDCRRRKKHQYGPDERITGNNFDIGSYEQISAADKQRMLKELIIYCVKRPHIMDIPTFYTEFFTDYAGRDEYFNIVITYNSIIRSVVAGNYLKYKREQDEKRMQDEEDRRNSYL